MNHRLFALLLLAPLLGGCATKRDLQDLRVEVEALREAQTASVQEIQRQNSAMLDSLAMQGMRLRGDLSNQLIEMERQLVQIQELSGQGQQQLTEIRTQLRAREEAINAGAGAPSASGAPGNAEELFNTSLASMRRGSLTTARAGFEEFLRNFPQHALAPEAQFNIGETFAEGNDPARALEAYGKVVELYPTATKASAALYRSGMIEVERGNRDAARRHFDRVVSSYPRSVEAPLAREQIQRLGRR